MNTMTLWGLIQSLVMTVVIIINGLGWRAGWLAGASAQGVMVLFDFGLFGTESFLFLLIPMTGFVVNWFMHEKRKHNARARIIARLSTAEEEQIVHRFCFRQDVALVPNELAHRLLNTPPPAVDITHAHPFRGEG